MVPLNNSVHARLSSTQSSVSSTQSSASSEDGARVLVERDQTGVVKVILNRPSKLNALDMKMFTEICEVATKLKEDKSVRVIILSGAGRAFCSGLDVVSVSSNPFNFEKLLAKPAGTAITNLAQDVGYLWREIPVPVIAVLHGVCLGGGLQIALGADIRLSTADCKLSVMEAKWGLIPDMSARYPHILLLLGPSVALIPGLVRAQHNPARAGPRGCRKGAYFHWPRYPWRGGCLPPVLPLALALALRLPAARIHPASPQPPSSLAFPLRPT